MTCFGREDAITRIPPVVVATPRVDVPLAVVGVPVHVDNAGALVSKEVFATVYRILSSLHLIRDFKIRFFWIPTDQCFCWKSDMRTRRSHSRSDSDTFVSETSTHKPWPEHYQRFPAYYIKKKIPGPECQRVRGFFRLAAD